MKTNYSSNLVRYIKTHMEQLLPPLLLDGATGTQLIEKGIEPGECYELWNIEHADIVKSIAKSYFDAGSDAVLTNTYGGSSIKLASYGLQGRTYELNKAGAENAVAVRPQGKFVIACVGPTGKLLNLGDFSIDDMTGAFTEQIKGLRDGGVDAISLDTFYSLDEIKCAIRAVKENSDLPFMCSLTFDRTVRGDYRTNMGVSIPQAAEAFIRAGALVMGSNCGNGIENMTEITREYRKFSAEIKIKCEPNAGAPFLDSNNKTIHPETPEFFKQHLPEILECKPSIVGGCCGTTPEHIRAMREVLDSFS